MIRPQHLEKMMRPKYKSVTRYHRICTAQRSKSLDGSEESSDRGVVQTGGRGENSSGQNLREIPEEVIWLSDWIRHRRRPWVGGRDDAGKRVKTKNKKGAGIAFTEKGEKTKGFIKGEVRVGAEGGKTRSDQDYVRGSRRRKSGR